MLKVNCEACSAPYEVDPRRIPASGLKMRCPACGASVHVKPPSEGAAAGTGADLDLDLPAPKAAGALPKKYKGTQVGLGMAMPPQAAQAPAAKFAPAAPELADLPAPKAAPAAKIAPAIPELADLPAPKAAPAAKIAPAIPELADLPAPKAPAKTAPAATQRLAPTLDDLAPQPAPAAKLGIGDLDDLDLPAPKPITKGTQRIGGFDVPAAAAPAKKALAPDFDSSPGLADLPAPKGVTDLPAPKGLTDLPAPKGMADLPAPKAVAEPAVSAAPSPGLVDLPAPKDVADLPAAKGLADLPAAKAGAAPGGMSLDLDLPAPKAPAADAKKSFARPGGAAVQPKPVTAPQLPQGLPKDSLAMDPEPFFAASKGLSPLEKLDDIGPTKTGAGDLDLPAPGDLPTPKKQKGTVLGLGMKLPKDSLDMPGAAPAFAPAVQIRQPLAEQDLPAPADLPTPKKHGPAQAPLDELDLPAPGDLPVRKPAAAAGTALGIGPIANEQAFDLPSDDAFGASHDFAHAGTEMGLGQMLDGGFELPPVAPANEVLPHGFDQGTSELDLPPPAGEHDFGGGFDMPGGFDPAQSLGATFGGPAPGLGGSTGFDGSLDLPPPGGARGGDPSALIDLNRLALPSTDAMSTRGGGLGTLDFSADELEVPSGERSSNVLPLPTAGDRATGGFGLPSMGDLDLFGDAAPAAPSGKLPRGQTMELDFDMSGSSIAIEEVPSRAAKARPPTNPGNAFGELDFGLNPEPAAQARPMPMPLPQPVPVDQGRTGFAAGSVEAELLGNVDAAVAEPTTKKKKKKKRGAGKSIPAWVWPIVVLVMIAGTGVGLGLFTDHGYFGLYLLEQLLPAAGDPVRVHAAIQQAEKNAKSDTYVDVRKSLVTLSDARNEAGLNRELLARSLLHEALYQLRFGEDAQSAQRSVAIVSRLMERGGKAPGLELALAADAARRGELKDAAARMRAVPKDRDPYRSLVAGEIALLAKKPEDAEKAFNDAIKNGAGARGQWGLARALLALEKLDDAEAAAKATLELSPRHSAALTLIAERALERGDMKTAIDFTTKASGGTKIDGAAARPSRGDRTRAWALMGKIEEKLEHPREAQEAYEKALAADPLRVDVLIGSGRMLMRLARPRDALARFDSAVSAKPGTKPGTDGRIPLVEAQLGAVQALLAQERSQEAMQRITGLLGSFAENPEVNLWAGHTLVGLEKYEEAEDAFKKSISLAPTTFAGYVALSQLLFKRDRPEEAARVLTEATGKVEDSAEVRRMLGNSELNRNHLPEAIHQFESALRYDPRDSGALFGLVVAKRKSGEIEAAEQSLARLEAVDRSFPGIPLERGQLLETRGEYESAVTAYKKALEERPTDTDLKLRLGAALVTAGHIDEADQMLKQVLKERPTSPEAEHFLGRILFARKDTAQAVQRFERAVSFDPLRAEYHLYLAWAHLEQGNLSGALASVNKALERDPNLGDAYWILGRIQLRTGAVKDALENFQRTRKLKPGRVEVLANMGDAYSELRELGPAISSYKDATRAQPENGAWWFRLGELQLEKGNSDEARVAMQEAVLRGDRLFDKPLWLADAHRMYADLLREGGRGAESIDHYKLFLQLAPAGHPDRSEVEQIVKSAQR